MTTITQFQTMKIATKLVIGALTVLACMLVVACQPQEKAPLLLDTPENAVRALSVACTNEDLDGALALYESTARQALADRIADMRQQAEEAGGITQKQQDRIALGMFCVPSPDIEAIRLETTMTGGIATVLYFLNLDGTERLEFQVDLVQQGEMWMITNVKLVPFFP